MTVHRVGFVFACFVVTAVCGCSKLEEPKQASSANSGQAKAFKADFVLVKREPPSGWTKYSDADFGISWYSPVKPRATRQPGNLPIVAYNMNADPVSYMFTCTKGKTRLSGSPDAFLDGFDHGMLGAMQRNGFSPKLVPLGTVSYHGLIGRKARIDVGDNTRQAMKCDLTSPDACYSLMVVGKDIKQLEEALDRFVTSIEPMD